jgi:hypothetical protein
VGRIDPFIGAQLVVAAAIALDLFLPERLTIGPSWLLPSVEGALLVALLVVSPHPVWRTSELRRKVAIALIALVSGTNIYSLVELCRFLLHHHVGSGRELIFAGVQLWLTNVLLFGLWYWELDRGGPRGRATRTEADRPPDFMFPQDVEPRMRPPGWSPGLIDYLYVSFTNASAFSRERSTSWADVRGHLAGVDRARDTADRVGARGRFPVHRAAPDAGSRHESDGAGLERS